MIRPPSTSIKLSVDKARSPRNHRTCTPAGRLTFHSVGEYRPPRRSPHSEGVDPSPGATTQCSRERAVVRILHKGRLIDACTVPGETRADDVYPAHPNAIRVSRTRWLLVYATRGFRLKDDDRSIIYQLRRNAPDGPVVCEGLIARALDDWEPFLDGNKCVRQYGSPVAFGVPRGARIDGKSLPHANVFAVKWRVLALAIEPGSGRVSNDPVLRARTQGVMWAQFRLNDVEDHLEVLQPPMPFRQRGFEQGDAFCELPECRWMNQTFIQPQPYNADASEWIDCNHVDGSRVAAIKHVFNPEAGRYEWAACGPYLFDRPTSEASILPWHGHWIITARLHHRGNSGVAWLKTDDPFLPTGRPVYQAIPATHVPRTAYLCSDGVVRLFTGDPTISPYGYGRNPLYVWDVASEDGFNVSNRRVVYDCRLAGLDTESCLRVDMCKLVPAAGERQLLLHRVAPVEDERLTQGGKADGGIYGAWLTYDHVDPDAVRAQIPWTL